MIYVSNKVISHYKQLERVKDDELMTLYTFFKALQNDVIEILVVFDKDRPDCYCNSYCGLWNLCIGQHNTDMANVLRYRTHDGVWTCTTEYSNAPCLFFHREGMDNTDLISAIEYLLLDGVEYDPTTIVSLSASKVETFGKYLELACEL